MTLGNALELIILKVAPGSARVRIVSPEFVLVLNTERNLLDAGCVDLSLLSSVCVELKQVSYAVMFVVFGGSMVTPGSTSSSSVVWMM